MELVPIDSDDKAARMEALNRYRILDTPPEIEFDRITRLAVDICDAPISLISLIDSKRQWIKSCIGVDVAEVPREISFCARTILGDDLFIVPDVSTDDRFRDTPVALRNPNISTYMGAPLVTREGFRLGALCVLYSEITVLREFWKEHIKALAAIVVDQLELRVALTVAAESEARFGDVARAAGERIWETDENHRFTYISESTADSVLPPAQLIGRTRWDFPDVDIDLTQFDAHIEMLDNHQPFHRFEYNYVDRTGRRLYRQVSGNPVFHDDGRFRGHRGTTKDITEHMETFEDLKAATIAAE